MGGFLAKFFSTDSIISRVIRSILLGLATGGADQAGLHLPPWAVAIISALAMMIPAGQNQSASSTAAAKKEIPPHS